MVEVGASDLLLLENTFFCEPCIIGGVKKRSLEFCIDCAEYLCKECSSVHRRMKATSSHSITEMRTCPEVTKGSLSAELESEDSDSNLSSNLKPDYPGKPWTAKLKSGSILLIWTPPDKFKKGDYFQISYKDVSKNRKWKVDESEYTTPHATITSLQPNNTYIFRVRVVHEDGEEGPYSPESEDIRTPPSLALKLTETMTCNKTEGSISVYTLPFTEIKTSEHNLARAKRFTFGKPHCEGYIDSKTILLVGATGTGKSTFVNGIINYILGVMWEDPFRFTKDSNRDVNQAVSQTGQIEWYTINPVKGSILNYQLHIIDTPGFGDTRGLERDHEIVEQIRNLFSEQEPRGVTFIDAVCLFNKAPDARLTHVQTNIFQSIMSLFGKDIEDNICSIITFADGATPPVLAALQHSGLPFGKTFPFNNSCLLAKSENDRAEPDFDLFFWNMGMKSFNSFLTYLDQLESKSLKMSNDVLRERFCLQANFQNLKDSLDVGLKIINFLKQEKRVIRDNKDMIEENRNFEYEVKEIQQIKWAIPEGGHDIKCVNCSFKCHIYCICNDNEDTSGCKVMNADGFCEVCPAKCHFKKHIKDDFRYEYVNVRVKKTCADMQAKYSEAEGQLLSHTDIVDKNEQKLNELNNNIGKLIVLIKQCNERLQEIALRPNQITVQEFIDLLIGEEEMSRKDGYLENISNLKELREYIDSSEHLDSLRQNSNESVTSANESSISIEKTFQQITLRLRSFIPNYKQ